ncbi:MAG: hypothetical protein ABIZ95_20735 [Pyrinomonadaceae bacterium]
MTLPTSYDAVKLAALRSFPRQPVAEVVAVYLESGTRYFGSMPLQQLPPFDRINRDGTPITVEARFLANNGKPNFEELVIASDIGDERVNLNFGDLDGAISELLIDAEGVKVEIFYWLPNLDWFVSHWWGHLQSPTEVDFITYRASAACGFRGSQMPVPRRIFQLNCQSFFGGSLLTRAAVMANACKYDLQLEDGTVGILNPDTSQPYTSCPKTLAACVARLGHKKQHTGFPTQLIAITIGQTHGPPTQAVSRGNETQLKRPLRVIYGRRVVRDLDLLAMRQEANSGHPDQGFLAALFMVSEGPILSMSGCSVVNMLVGAEHLNTRLGTHEQPATAYAPDVSNFNRTAHFFGRVGPLNPGGYSPANVQGQCTVAGRCEIRIYTDEETFTLEYTTNTAWCLLDLYREPLFGHGLDPNRFVITDWIELAHWSDDVVSYTDVNGVTRQGTRNTFNADVQGRSVQAQFRDVCLWYRFTMPFQHLGKLRIRPLRGLTEEELAAVPVFYADGANRNIMRDGAKKMFTCSRVSDRELPNELSVLFEMTDPAQNINNVERPLTFGNEQQQLRAGRAFGDITARVVPQQYQAFGIINEAEVIRKAQMLLDLGEFDGGGLKNNFRIQFTTTFRFGFELYQSQVIRVESEQLARVTAGLQEGGFKYYRVINKRRSSDLSFEVTAQAYPELYWADLETIVTVGGTGPGTDAYEAEDAANELFGTAEVHEDADCSNDAKVIGLGADGSLEFRGVAGYGGLHNIVIAYKCAIDRVMHVRINSGAAVLLNCPATSSVPGRVFFNTTLPVSESNTVTIFNPAVGGGGFLLEDPAPCPDIDFMYVVQIIEPGGGGPCRSVFGEGVSIVNGRLEVPIDPGGCD